MTQFVKFTSNVCNGAATTGDSVVFEEMESAYNSSQAAARDRADGAIIVHGWDEHDCAWPLWEFEAGSGRCTERWCSECHQPTAWCIERTCQRLRLSPSVA